MVKFIVSSAETQQARLRQQLGGWLPVWKTPEAYLVEPPTPFPTGRALFPTVWFYNHAHGMAVDEVTTSMWRG